MSATQYRPLAPGITHQPRDQGGPKGPSGSAGSRPSVRGKFLWVDNRKLYIRGVAYGPFRPNQEGDDFPEPEVVDADLALMAASGVNTIRTYTAPPRWLLDAARSHGLWVMVGVPWEQHIAFLDDRKRARDIETRVRAAVASCAGHPAVLCYAVGNEIPASIVRWQGPGRLQSYVEKLYRGAKAEDPQALVTYVNYPSTEYLDLPFLDFVSFNVYLESRQPLEAYLARLQNLAGDRPLVIAELGLDSYRHGREAQASALPWQIETAFRVGCAGVVMFSWTDDWTRGGYEVDDWAFGLTDRQHTPKPALAAIGTVFAKAPFARPAEWPRITVIVCSHNGSRTIRQCCDGLSQLDYPDFEVIVVDDGSTDQTAKIARQYGFRVISTGENGGLGRARNVGLEAAGGEIVAYLDDDAVPDPHWLRYLAITFSDSDFVGVGGPNIPPPDGLIAQCFANAPGGAIHVLVSDREAEHIPGCNMAFRRAELQALGGFDAQFWVAGDDVDICWRFQERGDKLGFSHGAMVWHRRRDSLGAYWRQQQRYGEAEALLERKWPSKYNSAGHLSWRGHIYGAGSHLLGWRRGRIYQGIWGTAPFQSLRHRAPGLLDSLPQMPEWYLGIGGLALLAILGLVWTPLLFSLPLLLATTGLAIAQAVSGARRAQFSPPPRSRLLRLALGSFTTCLHLLQPLARLYGRLRGGLTPWRQRGPIGTALPRPRTMVWWSEHWASLQDRLEAIESTLRAHPTRVLHGGPYERWDLEVREGMLGAARLRMAVEEHGRGKQLVRFRTWARPSRPGLVAMLVLAGLSLGAAWDQAWVASALLGSASGFVLLRIGEECGRAAGALLQALSMVQDLGRSSMEEAKLQPPLEPRRVSL